MKIEHKAKTVKIQFFKGRSTYIPSPNQKYNFVNLQLCYDGLFLLGLIPKPYPERITVTATNKDPKKKGYRKFTFEPHVFGEGLNDPDYPFNGAPWLLVKREAKTEPIVTSAMITLINSLKDSTTTEANIILWLKIDTEHC